MSPEKEMAIGFIITFSENPDKILDSIHSPVDVDHLISKRIEYAKTPMSIPPVIQVHKIMNL